MACLGNVTAQPLRGSASSLSHHQVTFTDCGSDNGSFPAIRSSTVKGDNNIRSQAAGLFIHCQMADQDDLPLLLASSAKRVFYTSLDISSPRSLILVCFSSSPSFESLLSSRSHQEIHIHQQKTPSTPRLQCSSRCLSPSGDFGVFLARSPAT